MLYHMGFLIITIAGGSARVINSFYDPVESLTVQDVTYDEYRIPRLISPHYAAERSQVIPTIVNSNNTAMSTKVSGIVLGIDI